MHELRSDAVVDPALNHVGPLLLGSVQRLFFSDNPKAIKRRHTVESTTL